ncbi:MAG: helix-turn-helix domain-containing protein [Spirochaetota bacterium]|nr:helix-turn-helix domain-containing protein [Spirochaetota bacterium]
MNDEESFKLYLDEFTHSGEPIRFIRRNPQIPYPLHNHDFSELVIILSGRGTHITKYSSFELIAGDVFVINGETAHGYENPENLHLINILYQPELLTKNAADLTALPGYHVLFNLEPKFREDHQFNSRLHLSPKQIGGIIPLIQEIENELESDNPGRLFMASAHFYALLGHLCRQYSNDDPGSGRQLLRIGKALSLLENSLQRSVSLAELTELTAMSVSTLNRTFKEAAGYSPIDYHLRIRIKKAGEILCSSNFSVSETASQTGFDDSNYFSRQFKKIMGVSPLEFRKYYR